MLYVLMCAVTINHLERISSTTLEMSKETLHFQCERIIRPQLQTGAAIF